MSTRPRGGRLAEARARRPPRASSSACGVAVAGNHYAELDAHSVGRGGGRGYIRWYDAPPRRCLSGAPLRGLWLRWGARGRAMVMSQADIDALIAGQTAEGADDAPAADDEPSVAAEDPGTPEEQPAEDEQSAVRSWSASATTETDKLNTRIDEVEARLEAIEAVPAAAAGSTVDDGAIPELRAALAQANATVQRLSAAVDQLTLQSQASLGFDAQHTFDCPSCGSHGTIAVPVSCTNCGHEAEWGFWPGQ